MKIPKSLSLERKRRAWEMHLKFYKHHEIAEQLEMKVSAVSRMLGRLNKEFKEKLTEDIEDIKTGQIARLEQVAREAFEAWEKSKTTSKIEKEKKAVLNGQTVGAIERTNEAREQDGDPRYLKIAMEAMADIRKITGADAPLKLQHSGDSKADAIKLDYPTSRQKFLEELARITGQGGVASDPVKPE